MQETPTWECVLKARAEVGEAPTWVPESNRLFWIDIYGPTLNSLDPETGQNESWRMPDTIGSFALFPDLNGAVIALKDGLYRFDFETAELRWIVDAPYDTGTYRFNDGRCDRAGRFWIGSTRQVGSHAPDGGAAFYRFDDRGLSREIIGTTVANGLAWSPDNRTMYIADRPGWQILAFDYHLETGTAGNRRRFVSLNEGEYPDGAAMDEEGGYWIALFRAGCIRRYMPDGSIDRELAAPSHLPTMVAFGGHDMSTLYVTTSLRYLDESRRRREPHAGGIFRCDVGVRGLPEPKVLLDLDTRSKVAGN